MVLHVHVWVVSCNLEVDDGMLWLVVVGGHSVWAGRVTCIITPFSEIFQLVMLRCTCSSEVYGSVFVRPSVLLLHW